MSSTASGNTDAQLGNYQRLVEAGADVTGNLAGSAIGLLAAGPAGALAGAVLSPVLKHLLGLATDVIQRGISTRETKRIGATLTFAAAKIRERLDNGQELRSDGFFDVDASDRAPADEIAEGVVIAAQREHEEKKLKFYGNMLANLAFAPGVDRAYSNFLLRTAETLSYRQYCLLALLAIKNSVQGLHLRQTDYRTGEPGQDVKVPLATIPILYEVFDLDSRGLVAGGTAMLGVTDVNPSQLKVQGAGSLLVNLMELHTIDLADINALIPPLQ